MIPTPFTKSDPASGVSESRAISSTSIAAAVSGVATNVVSGAAGIVGERAHAFLNGIVFGAPATVRGTRGENNYGQG